MNINKYRKAETANRMWLALAIFMLIFNSTAVKKYIRLQLYRQGAPIELSNAEHINICNHGDCTLLERHEITTSIGHAVIQSSDLDIFLFLSVIAAGIALLFVRKRGNSTNYPDVAVAAGGPVPLYLHICKLQV